MERCYGLAALLLFILVVSPSAHGDTYHPLSVGTEWHYATQSGLSDDTSITGEREILGVVTAVRLQEINENGEPPFAYETYWTANEEGDLWLHGHQNVGDSVGVAYSPPVLMVDAPLFYGKSWVTSGVQPCFLDGTPLGTDPIDYPAYVSFAGNLEVPAGTFYSFGIAWGRDLTVFHPRSGETYDIFGRRVRPGSEAIQRQATEWYSEGVGMVQYLYPSPDDMLKLTSWQPTPVATESWGTIKSHFR